MIILGFILKAEQQHLGVNIINVNNELKKIVFIGALRQAFRPSILNYYSQVKEHKM